MNTACFVSGTDFLRQGGEGKAADYVAARLADALSLKRELDTAFGGTGPQHGCTATLYNNRVQIGYDLLSWLPFRVFDRSSNTAWFVRTEAQVLAYILARFW